MLTEKEAEIIKKYNINLHSLEQEQIQLAKNLQIEDYIDFSNLYSAAGIDNEYQGNKILSSISVLNSSLEILDQTYSIGKMSFPYISGFRAYREVPTMVAAFEKLEERPDVIFVKGHGINHPRLGLASHFSLLTSTAVIGISDQLLVGEIRGDDIVYNRKIVGKIYQSKKGSKPLYVSPGNLISVETALKLAKRFVMIPHKLPEPLHLAKKYGKKMGEEIFMNNLGE